ARGGVAGPDHQPADRGWLELRQRDPAGRNEGSRGGAVGNTEPRAGRHPGRARQRPRRAAGPPGGRRIARVRSALGRAGGCPDRHRAAHRRRRQPHQQVGPGRGELSFPSCLRIRGRSTMVSRGLPTFLALLLAARAASPRAEDAGVAATVRRVEAVAARGPFAPTWASLEKFQAPPWYRDAKFGIFIHWGVYSVPAFGNEWYPRNMYKQD